MILVPLKLFSKMSRQYKNIKKNMNNRISIFWPKDHEFDFLSLFLLNLKRVPPLFRKLQLIRSKKRENTRLPLHRLPVPK